MICLQYNLITCLSSICESPNNFLIMPKSTQHKSRIYNLKYHKADMFFSVLRQCIRCILPVDSDNVGVC